MATSERILQASGAASREVAAEREIRAALEQHWTASAAGDVETEHNLYLDDAICDYPQSGERIQGRRNIQAPRSHHPGKPSGFTVRRIVGQGNVWVTEYVIVYQGKPAYTVSIMEFAGNAWCTRPSILPIPSRRRRGGRSGSSGWGEQTLTGGLWPSAAVWVTRRRCKKSPNFLRRSSHVRSARCCRSSA